MNNIHLKYNIFHAKSIQLYNLNMNVREEVKLCLCLKNDITTELAKRMTDLSGKNYSQKFTFT